MYSLNFDNGFQTKTKREYYFMEMKLNLKWKNHILKTKFHNRHLRKQKNCVSSAYSVLDPRAVEEKNFHLFLRRCKFIVFH